MQRNSVVKNYKKIAKFSIIPIYTSIKCINDDGYLSMMPLVGWLSLPWTVIATLITFPLGVIGVIGYSFVAPFEAIGNLYMEGHRIDKSESIKIEDPQNKIFFIPSVNNSSTYEVDTQLKSIATEFTALKDDSNKTLNQINNLLKSMEPSPPLLVTQTSSNLFTTTPSQSLNNNETIIQKEFKRFDS